MLLEKIKNFSVEDAIVFEENDPQFLALEKLIKTVEEKKYILELILANALICYQLSWKWEDYWEEFSSYLIENDLDNLKNIKPFMEEFLKNCKNNKRLINIKTKRLDKISLFINAKKDKIENYYNNFEELRNDLSKFMNQKNTAKTIVFAIKMYWYWARILLKKTHTFPFTINIPIDSRLTKLHEIYWQWENIEIFYEDIAKKLNIPPLHLDAIIWNNYDKLINNETI